MDPSSRDLDALGAGPLGMLRDDSISMLSTISLQPVSAPSRKTLIDIPLQSDLAYDNSATALSVFVLEACGRQLRQYHIPTLDQETVNLNIGQGIDYSIDVTKTDTGELVAVKHRKIRAEHQPDRHGQQLSESARIWQALDEIRIMTHPPIAQCANIISVKGFGWSCVGGKTTTPSLVVEFAQHGNLRDYLTAEPSKSELERLSLIIGVYQGLVFLHDCSIVHGDVKMENVLVVRELDASIVPKIADFGSSMVSTSEQNAYRYWGTDIYNPPEVRIPGPAGNTVPRGRLMQCDFWSFGLLCLEAALGGRCYVDEEISKILDEPRMEGFEEQCLRRLEQVRTQVPATIAILTSIVTKALTRNPDDRGRLADIQSYLSTVSNVPVNERCPLIPRYHADSSIIDLTDSLTMRAILKGQGTSTFAPEKVPWSVQLEIVQRYIALSKLDDNDVAGFANMNLAICHYLGFGVERNPEKVREHIYRSAVLGTPEARAIIYPLSAHLGFGLDDDEFQHLPLPDDEDGLKVLISARSRNPYRTPFRELLSLRNKFSVDLNLKIDDLHIAAALNQLDAVQDVIEKGAVDHQNSQGQTALLLACQNGNLAIAKLLLEHGSEPVIADCNGYTPLHMLCMFSDEDIGPFCNLLKSHSPKPNVEAFSSEPYAMPDFWDALVGTPLQWATAANNLTAVQCLLDLGASPTNAPQWFSPVQLAAGLFLVDILRALLENAATLPLPIESHGLFFLIEAHPFRPIMIHGENLPKAIRDTVRELCRENSANIATRWGTTPLSKIA